MKDNSYLKNLIENMDENTSLKQLQNYVDEMVNIRGFADETPQDCLLLLTEELGELAKEVRKSHTHIKNDTAKNNTKNMLLVIIRAVFISFSFQFNTFLVCTFLYEKI